MVVRKINTCDTIKTIRDLTRTIKLYPVYADQAYHEYLLTHKMEFFDRSCDFERTVIANKEHLRLLKT